MGTKNCPGDFDCYANADPDEPMFVLLGRDRHAPEVVRFWAWLRANEGNTAPKKVREAVDCAEAMEAWGLARAPVPSGEVETPCATCGGATRWQCSGCRKRFDGELMAICPNCGREGYWTGSVAPCPDCGVETPDV